MKNVSTKGNAVGSENQTGGITAHNVTINNYGPLSNTLGKVSFFFKNKTVKWGTILTVFITASVFGIRSFSGTPISTKDEFYQFLQNYLQSIDKKDTDANDYFTDNISVFYLARNINPDSVNRIRRTSDYTNCRNNIDKGSITVRKGENGISYWRYKGTMICYRPSKDKFQKCDVEMEYGINPDNRITSIEQIGFQNLIFTKERPQW